MVSQLRRHPAVLWRRSGPRHLLLCPGSDEPVLLDGVASVAWELLERPRDVDTLVDDLAARFEVDAETVAAEVETFLADLAALDAVVRS